MKDDKILEYVHKTLDDRTIDSMGLNINGKTLYMHVSGNQAKALKGGF